VKTARLNIKLTPEELARWRESAMLEKQALSEWVRECCKTVKFVPADPNNSKDVAVAEVANEIHGHGLLPAKKLKKPVQSCKHGVEKGHNCWQCGGIAVIE